MVEARILTDYRLLPVQGGGICAAGIYNGQPWQTTELVSHCNDLRLVKTKSGSIYKLVNPHVSVWPLQLQMRRPDKWEKLQSFFP